MSCFPFGDVLAYGGGGGLEHEGDFGGGDAASLGIDFVADPRDGVALDVAQPCAIAALGSFVGSHDGDDHGDQTGLGDGLAVRGCFVSALARQFAYD